MINKIFKAHSDEIDIETAEKLLQMFDSKKPIYAWNTGDGAIPIAGAFGFYSVIACEECQSSIARMAKICKKLDKKMPLILQQDPFEQYLPGHVEQLLVLIRGDDQFDHLEKLAEYLTDLMYNANCALKDEDSKMVVVFPKVVPYNLIVNLVSTAQYYGLECTSFNEVPIYKSPNNEKYFTAIFAPNDGFVTGANMSRQYRIIYDNIFFTSSPDIKKVTLDMANDRNLCITSYKIAGLTMSKTSRKLANWICKNYPDVERKAPKIKLKHVVFGGKFEKDYDPNAVKVLVFIEPKGKWYHLGWITKKPDYGKKCPPNAFAAKLLDYDERFGEIILDIGLEKFGTFITDDGKRVYYGRVFIESDLDKMKAVK